MIRMIRVPNRDRIAHEVPATTSGRSVDGSKLNAELVSVDFTAVGPVATLTCARSHAARGKKSSATPKLRKRMDIAHLTQTRQATVVRRGDATSGVAAAHRPRNVQLPA